MKLKLYVTGTNHEEQDPAKAFHVCVEMPEIELNYLLESSAEEIAQRYLIPAFEALRGRFDMAKHNVRTSL